MKNHLSEVILKDFYIITLSLRGTSNNKSSEKQLVFNFNRQSHVS